MIHGYPPSPSLLYIYIYIYIYIYMSKKYYIFFHYIWPLLYIFIMTDLSNTWSISVVNEKNQYLKLYFVSKNNFNLKLKGREL